MEKWPDVTPMGQTFGTAIEVMELGELLWKAQHYDEDWADTQRLKEESGDALVYLLGVMSLLDMDVVACVEAALDKNDDRDWEEHQEAPCSSR
jgi:NTP pyrophosphatase (non-canonical NTP hydrolase)